MEWTEESIRLLTAFWADGLSTAEIGRRLGISKNAVVGKAHRLALSARPSPIHWDGPPRQRSKPRPGATPRLTGATLGTTLPPLESAAPTAGHGMASAPPPPVFAASAAEVSRPVSAAARADAPAPGALHASARSSASISGAADRAVPAEAKRVADAMTACHPAVPDPAPVTAPMTAPRAAVKPAPETSPSRTSPASARAALQAVASRPFGRIVTCCWPIGEPGTRDFHFCDGRSVPGKPYCEEHAALAYVKVRDRREDAA